jgi:hypothetical protein
MKQIHIVLARKTERTVLIGKTEETGCDVSHRTGDEAGSHETDGNNSINRAGENRINRIGKTGENDHNISTSTSTNPVFHHHSGSVKLSEAVLLSIFYQYRCFEYCCFECCCLSGEVTNWATVLHGTLHEARER